MKTNEKIRKAMKLRGIRQWELAEQMGISEPTFTRMMRHELSDEKQEAIISTLNDMESKKGRATILTHFEVVTGTEVMMETDSFHDAIHYARTNGWDVYSTEKKYIIYDGYRDEFAI